MEHKSFPPVELIEHQINDNNISLKKRKSTQKIIVQNARDFYLRLLT